MLLQVSIFIILLVSSGGTTPYYIAPSEDFTAGDNDTCFFEGRPLQPCSSLETLAAEGVFNDFGENVTVHFLPGRHVVRNDTDLIFASFRIVTLAPFNENLSEVLIECKDKMTISFFHIDVIIIRSTEFHSCGGQRGVVRVEGDMSVTIKTLNSSFIGSIGSALTATGNTVEVTIDRSQFKLTATATGCGTICLTDSKISRVSISNSIFEDNLIRALSLDDTNYENESSSTVNINRSFFINNTSVQGAVMRVISIASISLTRSTFDSNRAVEYNGGAIQMQASSIIIADCIFRNNRAARDGGAIRMSIERRSYVNITNSIFLANACDRAGGGISVYFPYREINDLFKLRNVTFEENSAQSGGGISVITPYSQDVVLENVEFRRNFAENGGAMSIEKILLNIYGYAVFTNNAANSAGGALMAYESRLFFKGTLLTFGNNSAGRQGGALFLSRSFLIGRRGILKFLSNNASLGGALFVKDFTDQCKGSRHCFYKGERYNILHFKDNIAYKGPVLYGGFLNTCGSRKGRGMKNFEKSANISSAISRSYITSDVINTCFCDDEEKFDCSERYMNISAIRGESITLMITTIDQYRQFKPSSVSTCDDSALAFGEGECNHDSINACQSIKFHVYSRKVSGDVILRSNGPCKEINKLTVKIKFLPCPRGFQLITPGKDRCVCDGRLGPDVQCHIDNNVMTMQKQGRAWFQYQNVTLQVCKHCPLGNCKDNVILQPLADVNHSQCISNHSGVVCGACKDFFSIAIGSSRCINCLNDKYSFLWLVPLFAVMGLILVLIILLLDITVATGLINGLIFYANILSISIFINTNNCSIHPILSVFISWVNLDFGIEKCFYSGMDMYQKTWLQFAFPLYIWLLVGLIIILSHYSTRVMRLLGRKVIPVLATLFLLSYAKTLKTIITIIDFIEVLSGDADNTSDELVPRKVWTQDGNVDYLSGKHIPLFIAALLFLVVLFLPYTLLLTFGQCLRSLPRRKGLRWFHSTAFISIMDAYHAPYNRKHRYWTGALLFVRCILLVAFVASYENNSLISNTFATAIVIVVLLVLKASIKNGIYLNFLANIFENIFLLNLGLLASTVYFLEGVNSPKVCACLTASISAALVTFFVIIACHIYYKTKGLGCNALKNFLTRRIDTIRKSKVSVQEIPLETTTTTTFVELRETLLEFDK